MKLFATSLLLGGLLSTRVFAEPWFGTQYVAFVETTVIDGYTLNDYTREPVVRTRTVDVSPTGTDPTVLSTYTDTGYRVTAVNLVVEPTAGVAITSRSYRNYYIDVVYTAPSSCSYTSSQTLSTALRVNVPADAQNFVTPTAVTTSTKTYQYLTDQITNTMAMLDPSDLPASVYSSIYSYYQPARYTSCRRYNSGSTGSGTYRSGGGSSSRYSSCDEFIWYIGGNAFSGGYCCSDGCHYTWGISPVALGLAIFFGWFGLFLIIGLIESWFIFRRTMLGHKARTGLPYGFALLCPILSCLTLFTVKKYSAKTPEQQAFLVAKWKEMSAGSKFGLWVKSFFRRRDPAAVALGLTGPVPPPAPGQYPPQGQWYPPPGAPGAPDMSGAPPMAAYPPQGYPPQPGYPVPTAVPREGDVEGQPKTVTVSESERN